ncbi:AraC family transcriptional regulator [Acidisoma cellulosilytica]|uniref:AraC family transcriptional regulator n=1 Tax=Acidisoma cellulosilyticum TaxID=2802395 RepID=A0A963Z4D0_9PROT|nr:AraC family transcriptional regulator [Acidisoma cellulosilyticum]MCB8882655.1 AraC family transcriptional regulator [Acidisoma cellulosilyticum]
MAERLENLTDRPDGSAATSVNNDLLSQVLAQIRLTGDGVVLTTVASSEALPLASHAGVVCLVTDGNLLFESDDDPAVDVASGDLLLLPHGGGNRRLSASGGPANAVVCRFRFDPDSLRGMIMALPNFIHIDAVEGASWLGGLLHFMMIEASDIQPGAGLMISRLIDLGVIRALRTWIQRGQTSGWLGGLADERIARALKAIHDAPMQRWSIDTLAGIAGMSRSNFCERFAALVGRSPLRYQNEWRLTLARDLLRRRHARVGEIGLSIGYESEAAFSRAYKALFGHSPRGDYNLDDRSVST